MKQYVKARYDPSIYYPIDGYPPYRISAIGDVRDFDQMKTVKWEFAGPDHIRVKLNDEAVPIERALAYAFLGKVPLTIVVAPGATPYEFQHISYNIRPGRGTRRIDNETVALNGVRFKQVPDDGRYYVSINGVVYDTQTRKFRYRKINENNANIGFLAGITGQDRPLEHVVYRTWVGPIPEKRVVGFKDGDAFNCHAGNLLLKNPGLGVDDTIGVSNFTEEDRLIILEMYNAGEMTIPQLAELYNCNVGQIHRLIRNDGFLTAVSSDKLNEETVRAIQMDRHQGLSIRAIGDKYGITAPTIQIALRTNPETMRPWTDTTARPTDRQPTMKRFHRTRATDGESRRISATGKLVAENHR